MKILYLDDNKTDILYVKTILGEEHTVDSAQTIPEALTLLRKESKYDIVLCDYHLRKSNGFQAYTALNKDVAMPSILLTVTLDEDLIISALRHGFETYLNKDKLTKLNLEKKLQDAIDSYTKKQDAAKMVHDLERKAMYDALTQLPNRALLFDRVDHEIKNAVRLKTSFALIFIDIDGFKAVNDTLGHEMGDKLLIKIANALTQSVRDIDTVSRLGGDEFVLLLPSIGQESSLKKLADKVLSALIAIRKIDRHNIQISGSLGLTLYMESDDIKSIISRADKAMYHAKKKGKSCWVFV